MAIPSKKLQRTQHTPPHPISITDEQRAQIRMQEELIARQQRVLDATIARKMTQAEKAHAQADFLLSIGLWVTQTSDDYADVVASVKALAEAILADLGAENVITDMMIEDAQQQIAAMQQELDATKKQLGLEVSNA